MIVGCVFNISSRTSSQFSVKQPHSLVPRETVMIHNSDWLKKNNPCYNILNQTFLYQNLCEGVFSWLRWKLFMTRLVYTHLFYLGGDEVSELVNTPSGSFPDTNQYCPRQPEKYMFMASSLTVYSYTISNWYRYLVILRYTANLWEVVLRLENARGGGGEISS